MSSSFADYNEKVPTRDMALLLVRPEAMAFGSNLCFTNASADRREILHGGQY